MHEKSVQLPALRQQDAPPTITNYWAPMIGLVSQLAARRPQVALSERLPMSRAFLLIRFVGQLAARRVQVALPGRLQMDWPLNDH